MGENLNRTFFLKKKDDDRLPHSSNVVIDFLGGGGSFLFMYVVGNVSGCGTKKSGFSEKKIENWRKIRL
jgi:hypothetical protein